VHILLFIVGKSIAQIDCPRFVLKSSCTTCTNKPNYLLYVQGIQYITIFTCLPFWTFNPLSSLFVL